MNQPLWAGRGRRPRAWHGVLPVPVNLRPAAAPGQCPCPLRGQRASWACEMGVPTFLPLAPGCLSGKAGVGGGRAGAGAQWHRKAGARLCPGAAPGVQATCGLCRALVGSKARCRRVVRSQPRGTHWGAVETGTRLGSFGARVLLTAASSSVGSLLGCLGGNGGQARMRPHNLAPPPVGLL